MLDIIQTAFGDLGKFNDAVKTILDDIQWTGVFDDERDLAEVLMKTRSL